MRAALRIVVPAVVAACAIPAAQVAAIPAASAAVQQSAASRPARAARPAGVVAAAGELADATTGKYLWSRGLDTRHPIASITKVMTALVVLSEGHLNRKIKVTEAAVRYAQENSAGSAGLYAGDVLTGWQLLEGLLLPSGADAAYLLARAYASSWQAFVAKMNKTAASLGMTQTHFANYDGLPWPTEYSTYSSPRDLLKLGEAAMRNRDFRIIVGQRTHYIGATSQHHAYYWHNTDLLLGHYRGALGIKTGFTLGAGYCLLFAAKRHGTELMGVVLDSTATNPSTRFTAAERLLNWGFSG